jgi:hypothetical protein
MIHDEIVSIEKLGKRKTVDIEVTGNHLFYANGVLTHNSNSDVDLTNTSESMGITHTADCILGLVTSEQLDELGQLMIKQLKNRWGDLGYYRRFLVGIDRSKMKIYELEESAQKNINIDGNGGGNSGKKYSDDTPVFDKTDIGQRLGARKKRVFSDAQLN